MSHLACAIDWEKVVRVFSAFLTPVIGLLVAYIAWQQHKTNRNQFKLALLVRRQKIFDATAGFIAVVLKHAKVNVG